MQSFTEKGCIVWNVLDFPADSDELNVTGLAAGEQYEVQVCAYVDIPVSLRSWYMDETYLGEPSDTATSAIVPEPEQEDVLKDVQLFVPADAAVDYKTDVTVTATASGVPEGYAVALYDGDTLLQKGDDKTVTCSVGKMTASRTFTAKIVDADANTQSNADGALEKTFTVTVKTGFFAKLKAFLLSLFWIRPKAEFKP